MLSPELIETLSTHFIGRINILRVNNVEKVMLGWVWFDTHRYDQRHEYPHSAQLSEQFRHLSVKRKAEYLASRHVALKLFKYSGLHFLSFTRNEKGAPIWPAGYIGSLSHAADIAIVMLASGSLHRIAGVDIENVFDKKTLTQVKPYITAGNELENIGNKLTRNKLTDEQLATLIFSAKESLFKALNPLVGTYFDFSAAIIQDIDVNNHNFMICLTCDWNKEWLKGMTFKGTYYFLREKILTFIIQ